jgi:hypothetical protein
MWRAWAPDFLIFDMMDQHLSSSDLPEPAEGSDEQPDPVPLMDRSCNANILEKVLEYLTKHHEFDKAGTSQVCTTPQRSSTGVKLWLARPYLFHMTPAGGQGCVGQEVRRSRGWGSFQLDFGKRAKPFFPLFPL